MSLKTQNPKKYYSLFEGWLSIFINIFLFIIKYWAGIASHSLALIADAWHTLSDSISSIIILIGVKVSSKPADKTHPFGHGRAEQITSIIIGVLLSIIGFNFIIEAIEKIVNKESAEYGIIAIIVTFISILGKEGLAQFAFWGYRKTGSQLLKADGWHHRSDSLSSIIILIGIFLANYFWWIDAALGIIVAGMLLYASYGIITESGSILMGKKPDKQLIEKVKKIAHENANFDVNLHHIHMHYYGDHQELTCHIKLPGEMKISEGHKVADKIESAIKRQLNIIATIHVEPIE